MALLNLTPHEIVIVSPSGETILRLPPSGTVARVSATTETLGTLEGIPLLRVSRGEPEGLPAPEAGVMLVVSGLVRDALPDRTDLASPGSLVRDAQGRVIGCEGLIVQ